MYLFIRFITQSTNTWGALPRFQALFQTLVRRKQIACPRPPGANVTGEEPVDQVSEGREHYVSSVEQLGETRSKEEGVTWQVCPPGQSLRIAQCNAKEEPHLGARSPPCSPLPTTTQ